MDSTLRSEHLERIDQVGYTIVEDAISADLIGVLSDALDRLESDLNVAPANNDFEGRTTVRIYNLLAHGEHFQRVPVHPNVLPIVTGVLDKGCLISSLSSIAIGPGETAQPIHADDQLIPIDKPHVPVVCNTMWALTEFTAENGATRLVPGSHVADTNPEFGGDYPTVPAEMRKGSVLIWHGSLWHHGGANTTGEPRVGIAMNYCAGWIRQQENQQLGLAPSLVRTFDPALQRLVGYSVYNGLIGHIDKRDPAELLAASESDGSSSMVWDLLGSERHN